MSAVLQAQTIPITLNGLVVDAHAGETLIQTAQRHGIEIPHLCYMAGLRPDGNRRACVAQAHATPVPAPSCCRLPQPRQNVLRPATRGQRDRDVARAPKGADLPGEHDV